MKGEWTQLSLLHFQLADAFVFTIFFKDLKNSSAVEYYLRNQEIQDEINWTKFKKKKKKIHILTWFLTTTGLTI